MDAGLLAASSSHAPRCGCCGQAHLVPSAAPGPLMPAGQNRGEPGLALGPGPQLSTLRKALAPAERGARFRGPETLTGVETQGRTQGVSPLPKRVLPSLLQLPEWSDFIKVIFQGIASGSQVTAQSAPERQTHALPSLPTLFPQGGKERTGKVTLGSARKLFIPPRRERREGKVGDLRAAGSSAPGSARPHSRSSRLARGGVWKVATC